MLIAIDFILFLVQKVIGKVENSIPNNAEFLIFYNIGLPKSRVTMYLIAAYRIDLKEITIKTILNSIIAL